MSPNDPATIPLNFSFTAAKSHVGMFLGNGGGATTARLEGFDADGNQICTANATNVSDGHTAFIGFRDDAGRIARVALTYVSARAESLDDLHFSAAAAHMVTIGAAYTYAVAAYTTEGGESPLSRGDQRDGAAAARLSAAGDAWGGPEWDGDANRRDRWPTPRSWADATPVSWHNGRIGGGVSEQLPRCGP